VGTASGGGSGGVAPRRGARPKTPSSPRGRSPRPPSSGFRQRIDSRGATGGGGGGGGGGAMEGELSDAANQLILDYMRKVWPNLGSSHLACTMWNGIGLFRLLLRWPSRLF